MEARVFSDINRKKEFYAIGVP